MEAIAVARRLFDAIEEADLVALEALYADEALQVEHPNRLLPAEVTRDKTAILAAAARGRALMAEQRFEIVHAVAHGTSVALEARWRGRLAIDAPPLDLRAGDVITARFAQFIELQAGRVVRQASYDCFDPWTAEGSDVAGPADLA